MADRIADVLDIAIDNLLACNSTTQSKELETVKCQEEVKGNEMGRVEQHAEPDQRWQDRRRR